MADRPRFLPGLLLDERDHIVLAVLAVDSVSVSVKRFDYIPDWDGLADAVQTGEWIMLYKKGSMFQITHHAEGEDVDLASEFSTAQANESAQFAIELALAYWPDWGEELRHKYEPRTVIPLPAQPAEA